MPFETSPLSLLSAAALLAFLVGAGCDGGLARTGDDGGSTGLTGDGGSAGDAGYTDGGFQIPSECASPGPFNDTSPTATEIATGIIGTWIYCETSIFAGAEPADAAAPNDGVGILFRSDESWQVEEVSKGKLVGVPGAPSSGTWSVYTGVSGQGIPTLELDRPGGGGVGASPTFSPDGRSMTVTTSAGGHTTILAKAVGTE